MLYYYIDSSGHKQGPVPESELRSRGVTPSTRVWRQGLDKFMNVEDVPELEQFFPKSGNIVPPHVDHFDKGSAGQRNIISVLKNQWKLIIMIMLFIVCLALFVIAFDKIHIEELSSNNYSNQISELKNNVDSLAGIIDFHEKVEEKDLISVSDAVYDTDNSVRLKIHNNTSKQITRIFLDNGYMHYLGDDYDLLPIQATINGNESKELVVKLHYRNSCSSQRDELSFNNGTLKVEFSNGKTYATDTFRLTVTGSLEKRQKKISNGNKRNDTHMNHGRRPSEGPFKPRSLEKVGVRNHSMR